MRSPHGTWDCNQSPRSQEVIRTRAHSGQKCARGAGSHPHSSAPGTQVPTRFSRRTVAKSDSEQSQVRPLASVVAFAVALVLLVVSSAQAHVKGCHSRACDRRIHVKRQHHWIRTHIWQHRWHHLTRHERSWARCISVHESGNRRVARESAHWSYFQWALSTWHAAGGSGNPENVEWFEQAVRAVHWAHRAGSSQWTTSSTCGAP